MRGRYDLSVSLSLYQQIFFYNMFVLIPVDRVLNQKKRSRSKIRRVAATPRLLRRPPHPLRIPFRRLGHSKSLTIHMAASPTKRKKKARTINTAVTMWNLIRRSRSIAIRCRHDRRPRSQRLQPPLWRIRTYWLKSLRPKSKWRFRWHFDGFCASSGLGEGY